MRQALSISGINRNLEVTKSDNPSCIEAVNIRFKDGKWRNSNLKSNVNTLARQYDEIFIHTIDTLKNWIGWSNTTNTIYWFDGETETVLHTGDYTSVKFQSSGNILTVYAKTSDSVKVFYSLFDRTANTYGAFVDFEFEPLDIRFYSQEHRFAWTFPHKVIVDGVEQVNWIGFKGSLFNPPYTTTIVYYKQNSETEISWAGQNGGNPTNIKFTSNGNDLFLFIDRNAYINGNYENNLNLIFVYQLRYNPSNDRYYDPIGNPPTTLPPVYESAHYLGTLGSFSGATMPVWDKSEQKYVLNDVSTFALLTGNSQGVSVPVDVSAGTTTMEKYEIVNAVYLRDKNTAQSHGYFEGFVYITFAFKLFDGTYIKYSFPKLIYVGSQKENLATFGKIINNQVDLTGFEFNTIGMYINYAESSKISDIISKYSKYILSVDVFMTNPVSRFDFSKLNDFVQEGYQVKKLISAIDFYLVYSIPLNDLNKYLSSTQPLNGNTFLHKVTPHQFINGSQIWTNYLTYLNIFVDLNNFTSFEAMPVDNFTAHIRHSDTIFKYNNRLMIANTTQKLFKGFSPQWFTGLTDATEGNTTMNCFFVVKLETDNGIKYVRSDNFRVGAIFSMTMPDFFGYPDSRATELQIVLQGLGGDIINNTRVWKKIELTKHLTHNFSYYLSPTLYQQYILELETNNIFDIKRTVTTEGYDWTNFWTTAEEFTGLPDGSTLIKDPNKISITEVSNPIVFPAKFTYNVGDSEIIGMASNADPISSGQFGQYPIIVFTKTGMWTLNISESDSIYISNITPLNGEVCTNKESITNISGAIFFISEDDIKMLKGPDILIISDIMNGRYQSKAKNETFYGQIINSSQLFGLPTSLSSDSFKNYLAGAKFGYDKDHDEFIVSNSTKPYSYVFNTKYKIWYKIEQSFDKIVQDYPEYYGVDGLDVYNLALEDSAQSKIFIETQAIEFSPDGLSKLLRLKADIKCLGLTEPIGGSSNLGLYILGSMDGEKWSLINGKEMIGEVSYVELQRTHVSVKYIKMIVAAVISSFEMTNIICDVEIGFKDKIK